MAFKWSAFTDEGNIASTALDSLGDATLSAALTAFDNSGAGDRHTHALLEINLGSLNPTGTPYLELYMVKAPDGTNYEDAPVIGGSNTNTFLMNIPVSTGSAAKRVMTPYSFIIPPCPVRFYIGNQLNVSTAASGNTVDLYTSYLENV